MTSWTWPERGSRWPPSMSSSERMHSCFWATSTTRAETRKPRFAISSEPQRTRQMTSARRSDSVGTGFSWRTMLRTLENRTSISSSRSRLSLTPGSWTKQTLKSITSMECATSSRALRLASRSACSRNRRFCSRTIFRCWNCWGRRICVLATLQRHAALQR